MLELTIRLVFSLSVVVGLLLLIARFSRRRLTGGGDAPVRVLSRQPLSRTSAVAVVQLGSRVLVLGTTEHQISMLAELDPDELVHRPGGAHRAEAPLVGPTPLPDSADDPDPVAAMPVDTTVLAGSVLSTQTWRQAWTAATRRAS